MERPVFRHLLGGSPMLGGPSRVSAAREEGKDALLLRATHDGYSGRYGIVHERTVALAADGTRFDGEDLFLDASGGPQVRTGHDRYAVRFHLHPSIKATGFTDGHGALLVMANGEVWTFNAGENHVQLEDGVYLAGNEGPRRTVQLVIHGQARATPRVVWSFQQADPMTVATAGSTRRARPEPRKLPL